MKRLQINAAATVFFKTGELDPQTLKAKEKEQELKQFAIEFKKFPIPEYRIKEAIRQLGEAIFQNLHENGLIDYSRG